MTQYEIKWHKMIKTYHLQSFKDKSLICARGRCLQWFYIMTHNLLTANENIFKGVSAAGKAGCVFQQHYC